MISCASIQKLERYGQLAQKRRTVEDFVTSSLRDVKRSNVHALTHLPTWEACLAVLDPHGGSGGDNGQRGEDLPHTAGDGFAKCVSSTMVPQVGVSESLVYAVSYATALVVHHMDVQRHSRKNNEAEKGGNVSLEGKVFATRLSEVVVLHRTLRKVAEACSRHTETHVSNSPEMVQALVHLLTNALDALVVSTVLRHADVNDMGSEAEMIADLCSSSTGLVAATARQLRAVQSKQLLGALYNVRPCPTLLTQYFSKVGANRASTAAKERRAGDKDDRIVTQHSAMSFPELPDNGGANLITLRLLAWANVVKSGSLLLSLSTFSIFQKISFCDAVVAESPPNCCSMGINSFRHTLSSLFASVACNRATRIVVYFRGDDIKLMQNNVRESNEYAMHTHVTTPPVEQSVLTTLAQLPACQWHHAILLMTGWIASIPFFFRSFCSEESWTVFAQEQRRMVWFRERQSRQRRDSSHHATQRRSGSVGASSEGLSSYSYDSKSDGETSGNFRESYHGSQDNNDNSTHKRYGERRGRDRWNDNEDNRSVNSRLSAFSLVSRASIISTLSKPSIASYRTFVSLIDANNAEEGREETAPCLHQSEDDNTNLPLILLEEVVLGLQNFLTALDDAGVGNETLDIAGFRTLVWRTIGELFAYLHETISSSNLDTTIRKKTTVFHLGYDLRYNKGLGYEILGLLFAKVVLPQLLASSGNATHETQSVVERALTMCLSAYEVIAPQVIDQNIRSILRIASRVNQLGSLNSQGISENVPTFSNTILHEFLVNLITRLGRSNQVIVLLDAIVCCAADEQNAESDGNGVTAEGLLGIFRHAGVQAALLEACNVCLNPECLLLRVLSYVSPWASADDGDARDKESNELSRAKGADGDDAAVQVGVGLCRLTPGGVLFLLEIVSSVLRGVTPTSISASAVLEQVTELELVLSAFLVNGLFKAFFTEGGDGGTEESQVPIEQRSAVEVSAHRSVRSSLFACANNAVRPKVRRHLVFGALSAIHNARALILSCLQDLGVSDLEGYLHLLEDSMWHLRHQIDAIVGPLTADDLSAAVSLSAQIRYALSTKCLPIVPLLALQRLTLARYVAVTLGIDVGPVAAARKLSALALSYMCGEGEGGLMSNGEVDLALLLANTLVEEEWSSVAYFARPRRFRSTVVWLLQASFAQAGNPAWLSRSMTACGGLVLEALSSVLLDISDAKIMACCNVLHSKNADDDTGDEGANDASLLRLFAALNDILCRLGHVAQWHNIMQRIVHWLLMIEKDGKNANSEPCQIQGYLLRLVLNFLSCEENAQLVFRWALIQGNERQMQESHQHDRQRGRKGGHGTKLVNEAFMEAVKMPFTLTDITLYDRNNSVAKENEENTDAVRLETVKEAIDTCTTLVQQLFSKKFIGLLLQSCCETQEVSATTLSFKYAAGILGKLYSTALAVSRNNRTSSGDSSPAQEFVLNVVDKMHKCCSVGNYVPLSVFFYEISGNVLAPSPPRRQVICRVNNDTRRTNEEEGHSVKGTEEVDGGEVRSGRSFASAGEVVGNKRPREEDAENVAVKKWAAEPQVGDVALRWVKLLRDLLEQVVEQLVNEQNPPQSLLPLLHSTTSLYMALERVQVTLPHPTQRTGEHMSRGEMKVKGGSANDQRLAAFAVASQLSPETVCQLRKLFAPSKSGSRRRSATVLLPLLSSHNDSVIRTVWVLYSAYEESRRQNGCNGEEAVLTGDSLSISWFATLLGSLNPHVFDVDSGFKLDGLESVLEELKQVVTREHSEHVPLRLTNLHREGPHNTEEATVWLLGQLHAAPMILRTFSASHAQPLLMEYVHALFHAVVSSPGPMPQSPNCFWGRRQRLLTAVAIALQRVSAIPCMRFAMWRNDVKRLLVAAGSAVVSADTGIRSSRELTNSMIFRVLQLCTLHLAALHDDDAFVDHQLSFVTTVLFNGSGGFYDGNLCLPELVILQILRLLSSTLLTRGVLWRRAHLMPALLSALLTRCLDGVSRGDCTRVVLNQLSSFLFQLVKDKNYGLSRDVSAPLKSLCLSSLTSCLFRQAAAYIDVFTTHSSDLDYIAADLLKSLQHNHLPPRRTPSVLKKWKRECVENEEDRDAANTSDATLCDLSYACVGNGDAQLLLRQAAERVDEEEGTGGRHIFLLPE